MSLSTSRHAATRITFVTWSQALGDTLLLVPALRALRSGYPEATIGLVARPDAAGLLKDAGIIDEVHDNGDLRLARLAAGSIPLEKSGDVRDALGAPDIVLALSSRHEAMRVALDALDIRSVAAGAVPPVGRHAAENALGLVGVLGVDASWSGAGAVAPFPSAESIDMAAGPVMIHPGSGGAWKCPPAKLFREVADELCDRTVPVTILQGPADSAPVARIERPELTVHANSLRHLAQQLAGSRAYVGNDSGVTHLAALLGVPVVAIFGPTHPDTWRPLGPAVDVIRACGQPPSPEIRVCFEGNCFDSVTAEQVVNALYRFGV